MPMVISASLAIFISPPSKAQWITNIWPASAHSPRETYGGMRLVDLWAWQCYSALVERAEANPYINDYPPTPAFYRWEYSNLTSLTAWAFSHSWVNVDYASNGNFTATLKSIGYLPQYSIYGWADHSGKQAWKATPRAIFASTNWNWDDLRDFINHLTVIELADTNVMLSYEYNDPPCNVDPNCSDPPWFFYWQSSNCIPTTLWTNYVSYVAGLDSVQIFAQWDDMHICAPSWCKDDWGWSSCFTNGWTNQETRIGTMFFHYRNIHAWSPLLDDTGIIQQAYVRWDDWANPIETQEIEKVYTYTETNGDRCVGVPLTLVDSYATNIEIAAGAAAWGYSTGYMLAASSVGMNIDLGSLGITALDAGEYDHYDTSGDGENCVWYCLPADPGEHHMRIKSWYLPEFHMEVGAWHQVVELDLKYATNKWLK